MCFCLDSICGDVSEEIKGRGFDFVGLGMHLVHMAEPYLVHYIGDVLKPDPVDMDDAFQQGQQAQGTKPYDAEPYEGGNVKALFIGINYYGSKCQLSGCINDVKQMLATLQKIQFPINESVILVDEENFPGSAGMPTRDNIVKHMAWLSSNTKSGDILFLHYSGHGSKARSAYDENDYNECICPCDYDEAGCIIDDDIFKLLAAPLAYGVRMTVVFDCCHSGWMMDLPYTFVAKHSFMGTDTGKMECTRKTNINRCSGDVLMISGCKDDQTSADVRSSVAGAGGAATQCLTHTLLNTNGLSYQGVLIETRKLLSSKNFQQVPQLDTSKPLDLSQDFSMSTLFSLDQPKRRTVIGDDY